MFYVLDNEGNSIEIKPSEDEASNTSPIETIGPASTDASTTESAEIEASAETSATESAESEASTETSATDSAESEVSTETSATESTQGWPEGGVDSFTNHALPSLLFGMMGIFIVLGLIALATMGLNKLFPGNKE